MKKIIPLLLMFIATTASAQTSFIFIPELKLGYANVELEDNIDCFHLNVNMTLGLTNKLENSRLISGLVIGRNGYSHSEEDDVYDRTNTTSVGSWLLGAQILHKNDNGLYIGGLIGCNILDDQYTIYYDDDLDDYDTFATESYLRYTIKGKIGYGGKHYAILLEAGYCKGLEIGMNVAFPIFRSE